MRDLVRKYAQQREVAREARERTIAAAEGQYRGDLELLKSRDEESRRKIESKHATTVQEIKKKYDQGVWLADSVLENEQNGAAADFKQARETINGHLAALSAMELQAAQLLATYNVLISEPTAAETEANKPDPIKPELGEETYHAQRNAAEAQLNRLGGLRLPRLFVGSTPYLALLVPCALAGLAPRFVIKNPQPIHYAIFAGGMFLLALVIGLILNRVSKRRLREGYVPFRKAIESAREATNAELALATTVRDHRLREAAAKRKDEVRAIREKLEPFVVESTRRRDAAFEAFSADYKQKLAEINHAHDKALADAVELERVQGLEIDHRQSARRSGRLSNMTVEFAQSATI